MGHIAVIDALKNTPEDQLQEITPDPLQILSEDDVMKALGSSQGLGSPDEETKDPDFVIVGDDDQEPEYDDQEDDDPDEDNQEEIDDEETYPETTEDPDTGNTIEIEENFFTAKEAVGVLDNTLVTIEHTIFKLLDYEVDKKDLHYTAKQKALLAKPLQKAFNKSKIKVKDPWAAFGITLLGLEGVKISRIIAGKEIDKKYQKIVDEKDQVIAQMQQQMNQMGQNFAQWQQWVQYNMQPINGQTVNPVPGQNTNKAGGAIRNDKGQFVPGTGQVPKKKRGQSTRRPGETRGRKGKQHNNIPLTIIPAVNE